MDTAGNAAVAALGSDPSLCLLKTVRQWPYKKTAKVNQEVLSKYFNKDPFFSQVWDIYILGSTEAKDVMVISFDQVKTFFKRVEAETDIDLSIEDRKLIFDLNSLPDHSIHFLGTCKTPQEFESLNENFIDRASRIVGSSLPAIGNASSIRFRQKRTDKKKQAQMENRMEMLKSAANVVGGGDNFAVYAIDIESWEKNHDIITELGLTSYMPGPGGWAANKTNIHSIHIVVKEHRYYKNGKYVADARENFEFGTSKLVPLAEMRNVISQILAPVPTGTNNMRQQVLVGHDINGDLEYLRKLGYDILREHSMVIFDTVELWRALACTNNGISLSRLCGELSIAAWNLHNAGNDSRYTMEAFLEMATRHISGTNATKEGSDEEKNVS